MTANRATKGEPAAPGRTDPLGASLEYLRLPYIREQYTALAKEAAEHSWSHIEYLERLIEGEAHLREDHRIQRRIRLARFPVIKTLDQFNWTWPKKINRLQVQNLFRLAFIEEKANAIFLAGVGLGKSHFSIALGHTALLARPLGALHHRHRCDQYPRRRSLGRTTSKVSSISTSNPGF